jgi:hypothetical protein
LCDLGLSLSRSAGCDDFQNIGAFLLNGVNSDIDIGVFLLDGVLPHMRDNVDNLKDPHKLA